MRWLIAHSPASTVLSSQPLLQFVEGGLCREFHSRFLYDKQERARAALPCQEPEVVIHLYNSVLAYLADVVSSERLVGISWPPPEFSLPENRKFVPHLQWNSPQHLAWLKRAIHNLKIPDWERPHQNSMSVQRIQNCGERDYWGFLCLGCCIECTDVYLGHCRLYSV